MYNAEITYFSELLEEWYNVDTVYTNSKIKEVLEYWNKQEEETVFFLAEEQVN